MADVPLTTAEMLMQQKAIDRQRKIAEFLQQQSFQDPQGQMISGHYVAPSWTQQAARLANGLIGKNQQTDLDAKESRIIGQQGDAERASFGIGRQLPAPSVAAPDSPVGMPLGSGMSGMDNKSIVGNDRIADALLRNPQAAQPAGSTTSGSRVIPGMSSTDAFRLYNEDPKSYNSAYLKAFEPTEMMRNNQYLGINKDTAASAQLAKMRKEGRSEIAKNSILFDNTTDKPIYAAPDFEAGKAGGFDSNGNPTLEEISGSSVIAKLEGDKERAKSAAAAGYKMKEIERPDGTVLMTEEDAANEARGGQKGGLPKSFVDAVMSTESNGNPNAVSPKGARGTMQVMPGTAKSPGFGVEPAKDNSPQELERVGKDYLKALHDTYKDPTLAAVAYNMGPAATDKWLSNGGDYSKLPAETKNYVGSVMTKTAVGNRGDVGIPLKSAAAKLAEAEAIKVAADVNKAKQLAPIEVQKAADTDIAKKDAEKKFTTATQYKQLSAAIPQAREFLKNATGSGVGALADKGAGFVGTTLPGAKEAARLDVIGGWITSNVPRFEGPQSDKDTMAYRQMAANVADRTRPRAERLAALDSLEELQHRYADVNGVFVDKALSKQSAGKLSAAEQTELDALRARFRK